MERVAGHYVRNTTCTGRPEWWSWSTMAKTISMVYASQWDVICIFTTSPYPTSSHPLLKLPVWTLVSLQAMGKLQAVGFTLSHIQ